MCFRAMSPVLVARKLARVRQATGCLANSAHGGDSINFGMGGGGQGGRQESDGCCLIGNKVRVTPGSMTNRFRILFWA